MRKIVPFVWPPVWPFVWFIVACGAGNAAMDASTDDATIDSSSETSIMSDGAPADSSADAKPLGAPRLYVGSSDGSIHIYAFDDVTYAITPIDSLATGGLPSFLAFDGARQFAYAVDENNSMVRAFSIDAQTGKLTALGAVPSLGQGPAYVGLDLSSSFVMVANYGNGTIAMFPRGNDGRLGDASATHSFGANAETHEIVSDPSNTFVIAPNKGLDGVGVFRRDAGSLSYLGLTDAGDGARHIAFNASGTHAYVIDENASTIVAFTFDTQSGALGAIQTLSSLLDASAANTNTGAEIQMTNDGKHVIASNRGDDSLTVFDVASNGTLTPAARVPTGGKTPRHFRIEETGRFLFVGNQDSNTVVAMKMDPITGIPSPIGTPLTVTGPEFVSLIYLP